jgi:hypothetical protein
VIKTRAGVARGCGPTASGSVRALPCRRALAGQHVGDALHPLARQPEPASDLGDVVDETRNGRSLGRQQVRCRRVQPVTKFLEWNPVPSRRSDQLANGSACDVSQLGFRALPYDPRVGSNASAFNSACAIRVPLNCPGVCSESSRRPRAPASSLPSGSTTTAPTGVVRLRNASQASPRTASHGGSTRALTPGNARSGLVSRRGQRSPGTRPEDRRPSIPAWCPG